MLNIFPNVRNLPEWGQGSTLLTSNNIELECSHINDFIND